MHEDALISAATDAVTLDAIAPRADDRKSAFASRTPVTTCSNCETPLEGRYCHRCGQVADTWHRPVWTLFSEFLEGTLGLDGRFWRTVPQLIFRPGHVTRNYLLGKRQRYIPPFRLFLFASLIFFLAFEIGTDPNDGKVRIPDEVMAVGNKDVAAQKLQEAAKEVDAAGKDFAEELPDGAKEKVKQITGQISGHLKDASAKQAKNATDANAVAATDEDGEAVPYSLDMGNGEQKLASRDEVICGVRKALVPEEVTDKCKAIQAEKDAKSSGQDKKEDVVLKGKAGNVDVSVDPDPDNNPFLALDLKARQHLADNVETAIRDPDRYAKTIARWAPRVGFLLAPVFALMLASIYFWRRGIVVYDHMVVSLHFHAFIYLFLTLLIPFGLFNGAWMAIVAFFLWSNYQLYRIQRNVYDCGRFTAILRTLFLDVTYLFVLVVATLALLALSLLYL